MKKGMKSKKSRGGARGILLLGMVFLAGLSIFSYPFISSRLARWRASRVIEEYRQEADALPEEVVREQWEKAEAYNNALIGDPVEDPFIPGSGMQLPQNYLEVLNVMEAMAYIEIPKISVSLPIYHGVSEEVLKKGVGHMEGTAFPIGGSGTHCLLTGHTGLPEAELFTRLTELETGDCFFITVLGKELVYQTDQIEVILPDELGELQTEPGEDYVTLITCTPYGVNSHRLLVRGTRVYRMEKSIAFPGDYPRWYLPVFAVSASLSGVLAGICLRDRRRRKRFLSGRRKKGGKAL